MLKLMQTKSLRTCRLATLALTCIIAACSARANTYYIDSQDGNDTNNGLSEQAPWKSLTPLNATEYQPGDRILIKAGTVLTGMLSPKGSGEKSQPIVLDMYGEGDMPKIIGNQGVTVLLRDVEFWTLRNLDITNPQGRLGVHVDVTRNYKEPNNRKADEDSVSDIRLEKLIIHDIRGEQTNVKDRLMGGILLTNSSPHFPYRKLRIEDCKIYDIEVIGLQSTCRKRMQRPVLRNLEVHDCGQDGIILRDANDALIEHCKVYRTGLHKKRSTAGLWLKNNDGSVIQYCEAYENTNGPYHDGMAFDFDQNVDNSIIQYCYSHDNQGGFIMICPIKYENTGNIIRFNISENDGRWLFRVKGDFRNTRFYNNTVYVSKDAKHKLEKVLRIPGSGPNHNLRFQNNLIYLEQSAEYTGAQPGDWDTNCFFGTHHESEPEDPNKILADPLLLVPGTGKSIDQLDGYILRAGSPCLKAGRAIPGMPEKDLWGNPVDPNQPNIGAYQGPGYSDSGR